MSLRQNQQIQQSLIISPAMQQALNILALSQEELSQAIQKELLENPFLETLDPKLDSSLYKNNKSQSLPKESFFSSYNRDKANGFSFEESLVEPESLKSHILKQAETACFPQNVKAVLPLLISHLDERGRLNLCFEEVAKKELISYPLWIKALKALQSLEPAGIGATNLEECLLIQLRWKKAPPQAESIVINHLHNIKDGKFQRIAYDLNISLEETFKLCQMIQSLEPYPARIFASTAEVCIRPDMYIYKEMGVYKARLNQEHIPDLKISQEYRRLLKIKKQGLNQKEKNYLIEKSKKAGWFIHTIRQRQERIIKIVSLIAQKQKDFFDEGQMSIQPLKMCEIAREVNVHTSTISRAVNGKYAATPRGMIALKHFFQRGVIPDGSIHVSVTRIKEHIKKWIDAENRDDPLSDNILSDKIYKKFHIRLMRRRIGAYRASMGIPPLHNRRSASLSPF